MHELELSISSLLGSAAGGGTVVLLAKLYLQRAFKDLNDVVQSMHEVHKELALIAEKLKVVEENDKILRDHETRIVLLERSSG